MAIDAADLDWTPDGLPRSRAYGDVYFSAENGLEESRTVFLQGCGMPEAWRGRSRYVVGELGFGSGLNILALLDAWGRTREPGATLHIFTIEAHPMSAEQAARALARWPEIGDLSRLLLSRWPGRARGVHRVDLPKLGAILDVAQMEAAEALGGWTGRADAWFLDGFSPALNPAMWRPEVLDLVGARSAPGARVGTFTVAGAVRRGLQAAGFQVEKRAGFGRKRERLEAIWPGEPAPAATRPRVAVLGAGIAGASLARAFRALGIEPRLFDIAGAASGASGNPSGLVTPRLDAGMGPLTALAAQCFSRAVRLYLDRPDALIAQGVLQLAGAERDAGRFAALADSDLFEPDALAALDSPAASERLGAVTTAAGLDQATALVVSPRTVVEGWAPAVEIAGVAGLEFTGGVWTLVDAEGRTLAEADIVVLACGRTAGDLARAAGADLPPFAPVRGQVSWSETGPSPAAAAWGGYVAPMRAGLLFGATHDRGDLSTEVRIEDHRRNLQTLAQARPDLAAEIDPATLGGRAAVRATTPDRLPCAGATGVEGLFILGGLGSRGLSWAPLLAEHVAALATGTPSPLPAGLAAVVEPGRFAARARRKGQTSDPPAR